ncbi:serine hydrolase domain-containing protein [Thalassotalea ganghwensis]
MYKLTLFVFIILSFNVNANSQAVDKALTSALEGIRVEHNIPSMAVAIISAGEITYTKGFGFLDKAQARPTTKDAVFRVASISKLFTAQAVMQLVEDNKLALNDNIGQYLPAFKDSDVTILQLLTHSSGISDQIRPLNYIDGRSVGAYLLNVAESLNTNSINTTPRNTKPNKQFEYSDTNFNILGAVISAISGQAFEAYIHEHILMPSRMSKSRYFEGKNTSLSDAQPTHKGRLINSAEQRPYDLSFNPSEGLVSSVVDLSQWLKLTLAKDATLLNEKSYSAMLAPQLKTSWGEIHMALGWQVYQSDLGNVIRHPGSIRGYKSLILAYPEGQNAMVLLSNASNTPRWEIAKLITQTMLEHEQW